MHIHLSLNLAARKRGHFDRAELGRILCVLLEHGAIPPRAKGKIARGKPFEVTTALELARRARDWPDGRLVQLSLPKNAYFSMIDVYEEHCSIDLGLSSEIVGRSPRRVLPELVRAIRAIATDGAKVWRVARSSGLGARDLMYPAPRPPLEFPYFFPDHLLDLFDRHEPPTHAEAIAKAACAALPEGAAREDIGPLTMIDWTFGLDEDDVEPIRARLTARDLWLARTLGGTRREGWNAAGDCEHGLLGGAPRPPLTLYSPAFGVGYKAVHTAAPDAEIDATLRTAARWRAERRVDGGLEISELIVIAESRKAALALRPRALALGLQHIVYPDDEGHLWDPFPEGEWLDGA